jgi:multimeric flavodoxin WrbA
MKLICLLGSRGPEGTSVEIAKSIVETAKSLDATVETVLLNELSYGSCLECMRCKLLGECALEDELCDVLNAVRDVDTLVLASTIQFGDVAYPMKTFLNRAHCYLGPDYMTDPNPSLLKPGKKLIFILTHEEPEKERCTEVYRWYEYFLKWYGFHDIHFIRSPRLPESGDERRRTEVITRAADMARQLMA